MEQVETSLGELLARIADLESELAESQDTLDAIRRGDVDAIVVGRNGSEHVYTLRGADEPYRIMVESMKEGAVTVNSDGAVLYANARFSELLGVPLEHVIGSHIGEFVSKAHENEMQALLAVEGGGSRRSETCLRSSRGNDVPVYVISTSVEIDGVRCICLVVVDQTDQKRNEKIAASEKIARAILDRSCEAIVVLDEAGEITRANESAHVLAGRNVLMKKFDEAFTPEGIDAPSPPLSLRFHSAVARGESVKGVMASIRRPDGSSAHILLSAGPLYCEDHKVFGCVATLTDITERKRAEDNLALANEALQESNEELERFAHIVAHDLQEPVRTVGAMTQLIANHHGGQLGPEAGRQLEFIQNAAIRMSRLISDLLVYSRVSNESKRLGPVDANALAGLAIANLQSSIAEAHARVTVNELPVVFGDDQLVSVFQNLIGNALKYRSTAAPEIQISARRAGPQWIFEVLDNGIGFDMQYANRIFVAFQRLHGHDEYGGTGIGLAICKRIIERHGGRIWVQSQPGIGSTFYFSLRAV